MMKKGGTAETLSESLLLGTPLRHNAPTFSDMKDSDEENHHSMTPNVSSSGHLCFQFAA
jgi:BRCA1-associated RING domain protein 1